MKIVEILLGWAGGFLIGDLMFWFYKGNSIVSRLFGFCQADRIRPKAFLISDPVFTKVSANGCHAYCVASDRDYRKILARTDPSDSFLQDELMIFKDRAVAQRNADSFGEPYKVYGVLMTVVDIIPDPLLVARETPNEARQPDKAKLKSAYGFCDGCGVTEHLKGSGMGFMFCAQCRERGLR